MLFVVFINDLPSGTNCPSKLFADDTKVYGPAGTLADCQRIQEDIVHHENWANTNLMTFHPGKCKVLRIGEDHADFQYTMQDGDTRAELDVVRSEKDLGIIVDDQLSFQEHINSKSNKANAKTADIRRSFKRLTKRTFMLLYKGQVRPKLEYGNVVWAPGKSEIGKNKQIEKVQMRATKFAVPGFAHLEYGERLKSLKLPSMEYRRRRGDMIEVWKRLHGQCDGDFEWLVRDPNIRGLNYHNLKLFKRRLRKGKERRRVPSRFV